ncbi:cyclic peptide export ABC transporter [Pseudoalteromonas luteoviolacea]|uniref:cyclic peptide export ABC transporter n=1 Tax=Pseudoalteromonas luteoviolacea TaxID=43657 RepID=UPI001B37FFCA|nr:cyclic peptide export ABC transporter [Pseudoalteromonas luteoviolacea]MBQ4836011.1 cyclic peptide export ABC transporter [Pseudoalteromonas luteoviolacea]
MRVIKEITKYAPNSIFVSLVFGGLAGVVYTGLIPILLIGIEDLVNANQSGNTAVVLGIQVSNVALAGLFLALCFAILIFRVLSQTILLKASFLFATSFRKKLYEKVLASKLDKLEDTGSARLINALTTDINNIVAGGQSAPVLFINLITIFGMLMYVWVVNSAVFYFLIIALLIGVVTYQIPLILAGNYFTRSREWRDKLQASFEALSYGTKELKVNKTLRQDFFQSELLKAEEKVKDYSTKSNIVYSITGNYGEMICFLVIGTVVFAYSNYQQISNSQLISVVMIMLYLTGPIAALLSAIPSIMQAAISYKKLDILYDELQSEGFAVDVKKQTSWQTLQLRDVVYQYEKSPFFVGPVNLSISKGELVFLVGGNGSGKSTLSKLTSLFYKPTSGALYFDDVQVEDANVNGFRQGIFTIFTDYYLFKKIGSIDENDHQEINEVNRLIADFELAHKVEYTGSGFSQTSLSDGQRKRLALISAIYEDKELYLFDEWAADQDPEFRERFYRHILPMLRAKNKAVLVVSHDDRFFDVADKLIFMETGQVIEQREHQHRNLNAS